MGGQEDGQGDRKGMEELRLKEFHYYLWTLQDPQHDGKLAEYDSRWDPITRYLWMRLYRDILHVVWFPPEDYYTSRYNLPVSKLEVVFRELRKYITTTGTRRYLE